MPPSSASTSPRPRSRRRPSWRRRPGSTARFVQSDVYDAVAALDGERFDLVYTGLGALNWLPDLPRWASVVADLLKPEGFLYLSEFHPFTWVFADEDRELELDYFHNPEGESFDDGVQGSYADLEVPTRNNATLEWAHTLADVVTAVLGAGLRLELLSEHDYTLFPRFPDLSRIASCSAPGSSTASPRAGPGCR